ncbi:MAG: metallophosphoesterase [Armatimonadota bacterium]|nr:metallophosphoesterase [Armatimonadota bacterium]MCX7778086.1 metallophosphoesterase [Armatimonadota bacterium]MDW8025474.1 metallophosphoesterase [Armatimonadota bacterium]
MAKLLITILPIAILLFGFIYGCFTRVRTIKIRSYKAGGFRIAAMSDLHMTLGGIGSSQVKTCLKMAERHKPDAILLLGDIVGGKGGISGIKSALSGINLPIYAVPGNHDHWTGIAAVSKALKDAGVKLLVNDSVILEKGDKKIAIVGIDDLWSGKPDWDKAFANIPNDIPVILLSHNPDAILHPYHNRALLILSGHTHGGFWWMPFKVRQIIWRITGVKFIPKTEFGWRFPYGLREVDNTLIYITSGVTKWHVVPRWFTRPEVVIIEFF